MQNKRYMIWPEKKWVSEAQIEMWYQDAVENKDLSEEYLGALDLKTMCDGLDDAGIVTFGDPPP